MTTVELDLSRLSIKPDEGNETDEQRLQRALARPMMDGNNDDKIGPFQDVSIEPGEGSETYEERLHLALAMSMMDGNDNDEIESFLATSIEPDVGSETDVLKSQKFRFHT